MLCDVMGCYGRIEEQQRDYYYCYEIVVLQSSCEKNEARDKKYKKWDEMKGCGAVRPVFGLQRFSIIAIVLFLCYLLCCSLREDDELKPE